MKRSTERFLTTHTGSLPRPEDLIRAMYAKEEGVPVDPAALAERVGSAVEEVVRKQVDAGVDVVNDGEMSKPSYATYIKDRLSGFGGSGNTFVYQDLASFPNLAKRVFGDPGRSRRKTPACNAAIGVRDPRAADGRREPPQGGVRQGGSARRCSCRRRRRGSSRSSSRTSTTRTRRRTSSPSQTRCGTNTRPWPRPASCCSSIAPISAWAATSSTQT